MTIFITINQQKSIEWSLTPTESFIIDYLLRLPSWGERITIGNKDYYWICRSKVISDLPFVTNKPDTIYRIYKSLADKGLIIYEKLGQKDAIKILPKMQEWNLKVEYDSSEYSDSNPNDLGFKSELTSDSNPTYSKLINNSKLINKETVKSFKIWTLEEFRQSIIDSNKTQLSKDNLKQFFDYWREPNAKGKMKFQLQDTWETGLRLATWERYSKKDQKDIPQNTITKKAL